MQISAVVLGTASDAGDVQYSATEQVDAGLSNDAIKLMVSI